MIRLFYTQPVPLSRLWDQLEFVVIKILGGDFTHFFTNKKQEFFILSSIIRRSQPRRTINVMPHTCDRITTPLEKPMDLALFFYLIVMF